MFLIDKYVYFVFSCILEQIYFLLNIVINFNKISLDGSHVSLIIDGY